MGDTDPPPRRVVADYARPNAANARSSITRPAIGVNRWQIPPQIITMVTNTIQFHGLPSEDPNVHLSRFSAICDTFQEQGVTEDACKLRLFPFSLADRAHAWLESLPAGSITTWAGMKEKFLGKYFPPSKTARLRSMIQEFRQKEGDSSRLRNPSLH
ncbi:putative retrotransposon gag domain-containing protein [Helianthus annuus]|nr:putative retrotransposon gag domain-containing protein [Helianthus annuus]